MIYSYLCKTMILDVSRHKFSEGLVTLLLFAVVASVAVALSYGDAPEIFGGAQAPLQPFIRQFQVNHPVLAPILFGLIYLYAVLRLSRATVRVDLYTLGTMAGVALGGVALFGAVVAADYAMLIVVALVVAEAFGRLLYCFGHNVRLHYLFSAMLAFGVMPLVDGALIPLALVVPMLTIAIRSTVRESLLILLGLATPTFIYCYVVWLLNGDFGQAFLAIWNNFSLSSHLSLAAYLTLPRLFYLGVLVFLYLATAMAWYSVSLPLMSGARFVWYVLHVSMLLLIASILLLPTASASLIVALSMVVTTMLPLLFLQTSTLQGVLAYAVFVVATVVAVV